MSATSSRFGKRLSWIAGGLVALFLVVHVGGIALLRHFVEEELHPALPRGTDIAEVNLNLFTGTLEIVDFTLRSDGDERLRAGRMLVDIDPAGLLFGEIRIERADVSGVYIDARRLADGGIDLGLPAFGDDSSAPAEPAPVSIAGATLSDVRVDFRDSKLASVIAVDRIEVGAYSLRADSQVTPVRWDLRWDGRQLVGQAEITQQGDVIAVAGELRTDPLDLARAAALARLGEPVAGEIALDGRFGWDGANLTLTADLHAPRLAYRLAERAVQLDGFRLPGLDLAVATAPLVVTVKVAPESRLDAWQTELQGQRIAGRQYELGGTLVYDDSQILSGDDMRIAAQSLDWGAEGRAVTVENVVLTGQVSQSLAGDTPYPALNARLEVGALRFSDVAGQLETGITGLTAEGVTLSQADAAGHRELSGQLRLETGEIRQDTLTAGWQSVEAALGGTVGPQDLQVSADLELAGLELAHPALVHGPLALQRVEVSGLDVSDRISVDAVRLSGLQIPSAPVETRLQVAAIDLKQAGFAADRGASIEEIVIDGLETAVIRDEQGVWRYPMSPTDTAAQSTAAGGQGDDATPLDWRVGALRIVGDSHLAVADRLNPDSKAPRLKIEQLEIGAIDSRQPDVDTPFAVNLKPDEYAEFVVTGQARPLAGKVYLQAEGRLQAIAMTSFNGLIANDLGHRFRAGQLDNDYTISIENDHLQMSNALVLAGVDAEALPGKDGPPLATAIALLEDRQGNIAIDVPVSGDLGDPEFRVLGALDPIIMKAVAGAAALAIQPLGSALLVGTLVADQALKVTFKPVAFAPGTSELDAAGREYLDQLAAKLNDKPKLGLKFCGIAVAAERRKNDKGEFVDTEESLLAVAQQRAEAAGAYLQRKGVGEKQVRACRPVFDDAPEAGPRVEIRL